MMTSSSTVVSKDKKTWKVKVAKQFKKIQPGGSAHASPSSYGGAAGAAAGYPEGGSIGVPIDECPVDEELKIPLLVRTCCSIVEERGLEVVGVYRVPGNSAAVNHLTEQVRFKFNSSRDCRMINERCLPLLRLIAESSD